MIGDLLLAVVATITLELTLGSLRGRAHRREIEIVKAEAYLRGVHAANRVHAALGPSLPNTDARH